MKNTSVLLVASALAGVLVMGCGDDDGTPATDAGPGTDTGPAVDTGTPPMAPCPMVAPAPDNQMGSCCWRQSNASMLMTPELRIAAIDVTGPSTLDNLIVEGLLTRAFDQERFNWIMRFDLNDAGDVSIETGYGERNATDGTFAFVMGGAPMPGAADRWDPKTIMGLTLTGEVIASTAPLADTITVPVFDEMMPDMLVLELPLRGLELPNLELSEDRSCVGTRAPSGYRTTSGSLSAFILATDADGGRLMTGPVNTTLCMFIGGMSTMTDTCADHPDQTMWATPPDSICDTGTGVCTLGGCTASATWPPAAGSCNAWQLTADFAAQGVAIN